MHLFSILLLTATLNIGLLPTASIASKDLYVKPFRDDDCLHYQPCFTLTEYIQNASSYFVSNTTVHFHPGRHIITTDMQLIIENMSNLSFVGADRGIKSGTFSTTIECFQNAAFVFLRVKFLHISDIKIVHCGWKLPARFVSLLPSAPHAQAALLVIDAYSLMLERISIEQSIGYGLLGVNIDGNSSVTGCTFFYNMWREGLREDIQNGTHNSSRPGGNALLAFVPHDSHQSLLSIDRLTDSLIEESLLQITDSEFAHGVDTSIRKKRLSEYTLSGGSGLGIYFHKGKGVNNVIAVIRNCKFHNNVAPIGANTLVIYRLINKMFASEVFAFKVNPAFLQVKIQNCSFYNGTASQDAYGGGLAIWAVQHFRKKSYFTVEVSDSVFFNNSAGFGGGISYKVQGIGGISEAVAGMTLEVHNCQFYDNVGREGGGMEIETVSLSSLDDTFTTRFFNLFKVSVSHSKFSRNIANKYGGGVAIKCGHADEKRLRRYKSRDQWTSISFINCLLNENRARIVAGMNIFECRKSVSDHHDGSLSDSCDVPTVTGFIFISLTNLRFIRNLASQCTATLYIDNAKGIVVANSVFEENNGTAIFIIGSHVSFKGRLNFSRNRGNLGGAIHLFCVPSVLDTAMYLHPDAEVYMTNNSATQYGGAIAVDEECTRMTKCFFQLHSPSPCSDQQEILQKINCYHIRIVLENNTAGIAGDSIFGGELQTCRLEGVLLSPHVFWTIFRIHGKPSPTEIGSPPYKICFCNGSIETNNCRTTMVVHTFKGKTFSIQAASSGQYNYAAAAVVRTEVINAAELGTRQRVQELPSDCGRLWYSIRSSDTFAKLLLSVSNILHYPPAVIQVTFHQCPFGFEEWGEPPKCDCIAALRTVAAITCDTDTLTIYRPAGMWIGNYSGDVTVHTNCPLDYCNPEGSNISPEKLNEQCAFNRSGILCGACQPGLSLVLGSSQCLQCSNVYLLLLIPFALAGVALVFLLLKCNLTVSVGTINGLIFYANVVKANQAIFFPKGHTMTFTKLLSVFTAWVNLDLEIETCFYKDMTDFAKAWLQFVFPVYVWILVGAMIIGSRYSTRLTGSNAVPVLATLFLLSYAKLLRSVIIAISPITLVDRNGTSSLVWLQDGNIPFLHGVHILLFTVALVTTLLYVIPLTLLVILAPYLQARSGVKGLRWVIKLKPLLDAYQGPYKDKFRYWTGLMLLLRIALFIVFASNTLGDPRVNLLAITVALFGLLVCFWNAGRVYKSYLMHIFESFYLLNLGIFTAATQFLKASEASPQSQEYLTCTMVGSSFVVFCTILGYHSYKLVQRNKVLEPIHVWWQQRKAKDQAQHTDTEIQQDIHNEPPQPTVTVLELSQLREPLLTT